MLFTIFIRYYKELSRNKTLIIDLIDINEFIISFLNQLKFFMYRIISTSGILAIIYIKLVLLDKLKIVFILLSNYL